MSKIVSVRSGQPVAQAYSGGLSGQGYRVSCQQSGQSMGHTPSSSSGPGGDLVGGVLSNTNTSPTADRKTQRRSLFADISMMQEIHEEDPSQRSHEMEEVRQSIRNIRDEKSVDDLNAPPEAVTAFGDESKKTPPSSLKLKGQPSDGNSSKKAAGMVRITNATIQGSDDNEQVVDLDDSDNDSEASERKRPDLNRSATTNTTATTGTLGDGMKEKKPNLFKRFTMGFGLGAPRPNESGKMGNHASAALRRQKTQASGQVVLYNPYGKEESEKGAEEQPSRMSSRCYISPVATWRLRWYMLTFAFMAFEIWLVPFELVFVGPEQKLGTELWIMSMVSTAFFTMDILINCLTGYIDDGVIVDEPGPILRKYLKTWFWVDLCATFPWSSLVQLGSSHELTMIKFLRVLRSVQVFTMVRFLRTLKLVRLIRAKAQVQRLQDRLMARPVLMELMMRPILIILILSLFSHINASVWAAISQEVSTHVSALGSDPHSPIACYSLAFWWAMTALTFGNDIPVLTAAEQWLVLVVALQKLALICGLAHWIIQASLLLSHEKGDMFVRRKKTLQYFSKHKVPYHVSLRVLHAINETGEQHKTMKQFREEVLGELPVSLQRLVCEELWGRHLISSGLILPCVRWQSDFVLQLAMSCSEVVLASKAVLFNEGDTAGSAYFVLNGLLNVHIAGSDIPPFGPGNWVGEKALINPKLRRSATGVCQCPSSFMEVPAKDFHNLLTNFALEEKFQALLHVQLRYGLCGRCGVLGDHFSEACPLLREADAGTKKSNLPGPLARLANWFSGSSAEEEEPEMEVDEVAKLKELERFLDDKNLDTMVEGLLWKLQELGVKTLDDFKLLKDRPEVFDALEIDDDTAWEFLQAIQSIDEYQKQLEIEIQERFNFYGAGAKEKDQAKDTHYVFLSHYKHEAGTECALMRQEMESLLEDHKDQLPECGTAVFLDTEDLMDLEQLLHKVWQTHNFVLVLTENVLARPWVAAEIVTAQAAGCHVMPVEIQRPGLTPFKYPDEDFYERLKKKQILGDGAIELLSNLEIELWEVEKAYRAVFKKIAVPFSPHKSGNIRRAELQDLMKRCKARKIPVGSGFEATRKSESPGQGEQKKVQIKEDESQSIAKPIAESRRGIPMPRASKIWAAASNAKEGIIKSTTGLVGNTKVKNMRNSQKPPQNAPEFPGIGFATEDNK